MSLFSLIPDKHDVLQDQNAPEQKSGFRYRLFVTIFENNTTAGKVFDISLIILILTNVVVLMLESVDRFAVAYTQLFRVLDYVFMAIFTLEYLLRLYCVQNAKVYAKSFYGTVDLLAIIPSYMEFILPGWHMLMVIRSFRLLRIFRIFHMVRFLDESRYLILALLRSFNKIMVFLIFIVLLTIFLGSLMYVIEYKYNPEFRSIPQSIYWAIVTITTVGYGDIAPLTMVGKIVASFIMILGYAIIAVPTGIMSASLISQYRDADEAKSCSKCGNRKNAGDAVFCKKCGHKLDNDNDHP